MSNTVNARIHEKKKKAATIASRKPIPELEGHWIRAMGTELLLSPHDKSNFVRRKTAETDMVPLTHVLPPKVK